MVVKTGVSLPNEVYEKLVELCKALGYTSVSRAIRDAVELFIAFNRWWLARGRVVGVIQVVAPATGRVQEKILAIEAEYRDIVKASTRVPLGQHSLIVLLVDGDGEKVRRLYKSLVSVEGVVAVQPSLLPGG